MKIEFQSLNGKEGVIVLEDCRSNPLLQKEEILINIVDESGNTNGALLSIEQLYTTLKVFKSANNYVKGLSNV